MVVAGIVLVPLVGLSQSAQVTLKVCPARKDRCPCRPCDKLIVLPRVQRYASYLRRSPALGPLAPVVLCSVVSEENLLQSTGCVGSSGRISIATWNVGV